MKKKEEEEEEEEVMVFCEGRKIRFRFRSDHLRW